MLGRPPRTPGRRPLRRLQIFFFLGGGLFLSANCFTYDQSRGSRSAPKGGQRPLYGRSFRVEAAVGDLEPLRDASFAGAARAQSQRFGPVSAASAANTRDAPRDGRPSAPAARPRRAAPLEAARRSCGAASLCRAGRASGGPDDGRASTAEPARPRCDRVGPESASVAGASPWPARPCAPCRARAAAWPRPTARSTFSAPRPPRALALRARSGRRRERAAACFFGWVPGPAPAGRASARKIKIRGAYSTPYTGRRPRRRLHGALRLQQHRRGWGGFGGEEALASPSPPISRSAK